MEWNSIKQEYEKSLVESIKKKKQKKEKEIAFLSWSAYRSEMMIFPYVSAEKTKSADKSLSFRYFSSESSPSSKDRWNSSFHRLHDVCSANNCDGHKPVKIVNKFEIKNEERNEKRSKIKKAKKWNKILVFFEKHQ